ncbi:DUF748 domain-containing protein [Nitrospira sp. CMX1]
MRRLLRPRVVISAVIGLIAFYALFGFVLVPYIITSYVIPAVSEQIKHPVVLREAAFNPFALSLRLTGLEVREQNETPMVGFEELFVNLRAVTLLFQKVAFDEIRLVMPFVAARVNSEGKLNLLSLVPPAEGTAPPPPQPTGEPKKLMPVQIDLLEIGQGIVEYRDDSKARPIAIDVVPFEIRLRNFSTIPVEGRENAHAFTAEIGKGEQISWEGTIFLEPMESDGRVNLSGIKLKTLHQVLRDVVQFDIQEGVLGLSASYHFDLRGEAPQATVKNGKLSIDNLAIVERGGIDPVVTVPVFGVEGVQLDLQKQTIDVAKVHSANARFEAWLDAKGVLNFQPLFTPVGGGSGTTATSAPVKKESAKAAKPWFITMDEVALRNYGAAFEDRTLPRPGHVDVTAMNLTVKDVGIPFKKPLPIDLSLKLNETGSIGVKGTVTVEPLKADADLKLEHIEFHPFQPYLDRFLNADVRDGAIDLDGTVHFVKEHTNEPMLKFQGNLGVNQLAIAERNVLTDAVSWKALNINRIALDVEPTAVKIAEIVWQEPNAQIVIGADGKLNLSRLAAPPPPTDHASAKKEAEGEKPQTKSAEPVPITIDQVKLVKLTTTFEDQSIEPRVKTGLTEFGGTIKGLSSKQLKKADVNLAGKVGRIAPFKIVGKINPLSEDAFTDLVITLAGMDLRPTGPYSGKYVGYGLSKGKLSLDLKYKVSQKVLEAENLVHVDQLTFGEKTDSPEATSLPVPLVVGLLKDRKGQIEIDMPIRGNLNDPDFKYGKVVISTLLNLLTKVVASPFSLMGKLVPGGGESEDGLQFIEFQPGSTSLTDEDVKKLEALETALDERAGLRLDIKGTFDTTLDRAALQAMKLHDQLFEMSGKPREAAGSNPDTLSPKDEQRLVEKLYAKLPPPDPSAASTELTQPTLEAMKQRVAAAIMISDAELETLARQRAEAVRNLLLESGRLTESRVTLLDSGAAESGHEKVRTQLALAAGS